MMPAAPDLFSITTVVPSAAPSFSLISRAAMSVVPPGAAGTMMVIGLSGHAAWVTVPVVKPMSASRQAPSFVFIMVSSFLIAIVNADCRLGLGAQGISQGGTETSKMRDSRPEGRR